MSVLLVLAYVFYFFDLERPGPPIVSAPYTSKAECEVMAAHTSNLYEAPRLRGVVVPLWPPDYLYACRPVREGSVQPVRIQVMPQESVTAPLRSPR